MKHNLHKINLKITVPLIIFIFLVIGLAFVLVYGKQKSKATIQKVYSEQNSVSQINTEDLENEFEDTFRGEDEVEIVALDDIEQEDHEEQKNEKTVKQVAESSNIKNTGNTTYFIKINKLANVVTIYKKDENGEYTVPVKAMTCSTGTYTPAVAKYPNTKYKITGYRSRWGRLQGNVYGQYATQIVGNILFHSVPYTEKNNSSLEYWEYDKLGTTASAGCIRLSVADAKWIYDNISKGTVVEFYSDSNPGPLGKPSTQKISSNIACRGWDPTDMSDGNPWRNEKSEEKVEAEKLENTVENVVIEQEIQNDAGINPVEKQQKTNEENTNVVMENTEKLDSKQSNIEKTNTEKSSTEAENTKKGSIEKVNEEKLSTESENIKKEDIEKTNTEKADTERANTEKTNTEKANTERANTEKTNTEKANTEKTNTEKANTEAENIKNESIEKTNYEKSNIEKTNAELNCNTI